jgi:hypothetical protein
MIRDDDRLLEELASLPPVAPDVEWESRVRSRCHAAITRRASRRARTGRLVDLAGAAALCVYLVAAFLETVRLGGSF